MKINTPKLSLSRSSSSSFLITVDLSKEVSSLIRFSTLAYIKRKRSDTEPLASFEAKPINNNTIEISIDRTIAKNLPVGQFIYVVDLFSVKGDYTASNYINIEP